MDLVSRLRGSLRDLLEPLIKTSGIKELFKLFVKDLKFMDEGLAVALRVRTHSVYELLTCSKVSWIRTPMKLVLQSILDL